MNRHDKLVTILRECNNKGFGYILVALSHAGFSPGIYKRGKYWRMHIDCGSNCWHDGRTLMSAFRGAIKSELRFLRKRIKNV